MVEKITMNKIIMINLIIIFAILLYVFLKLIKLKGLDKLKYIKSFKQGKFSVMAFAVMPIIFLGINYQNEFPIGVQLIETIFASIELLILKFPYNNISALFNENILFRYAMYFVYVIMILNAIIFFMSFIIMNIINNIRRINIICNNKPLAIIIGDCDENLSILKSAKNSVMFVENRDYFEEVLSMNKSYNKFNGEINMLITLANFFSLLKKYKNADCAKKFLLKKFDNREINIIINQKNDAKSLFYVRDLHVFLSEIKIKAVDVTLRRSVNVYVFSNYIDKFNFYYYVDKCNGRLHYVNKYAEIAIDFWQNNPITQYIPKQLIDSNLALIDDELEVNIMLVGFGKINAQLLMKSIGNNQFLRKNGEPLIINYFLYDKDYCKNHSDLNFGLLRYEEEFLKNIQSGKDCLDSYLPLPEKPYNIQFRNNIDVNSDEFYKTLNEDMKKRKKHSLNYVIISYGEDLNNLDMTEKLYAKVNEWKLIENTIFFTRIKNKKISEKLFQSEKEFKNLNERKKMFGDDESVFDYTHIINKDLENMAKMRHFLYYAEDEIINKNDKDIELFIKKLDEIKLNALKKWTKYNRIKMMSSLYACLNIRTKLNLLGLDIVDKLSDKKAISENEYIEIYDRNHDIDFSDKEVFKKRIINYDVDAKGVIRNNLAIQEHMRWNAYMFSEGYVPCEKSDIINKENFGRDDVLRKHPNLTTFEGLKEYKNIVENCDKIKTKYDVIKYDYQLMDDLFWLIGQTDFKIVHNI